MKLTLAVGIPFLVTIMAQAQSFESLRERIESRLAQETGTYAVAMQDLSGRGQLFIKEHEVFHAASTMKTPVMIEVFRQARLGRFSLTDSLEVENEFRSIVDGSPYSLDIKEDSDDSMYALLGKRATVRSLVYQMITVSSNLATNLLIGLVGADSVTATMRSIGAPDIQVLRGVEDGKAFAKGLNNTTTAYDLLIIMSAIAQGRAGDSASTQEMIQVLSDQKFRDKIPALLPEGTTVAHKTGSITGVQHDSGIVYFPDGRSFALVLLSKGIADPDKTNRALAEVSRMMYDELLHTR
jgi:beta-lactamase class A